MWQEDEEEDVRSYWMTLRTEQDTVIWRRKLWIAICGGIVLEDALNLSSDRLLDERRKTPYNKPTEIHNWKHHEGHLVGMMYFLQSHTVLWEQATDSWCLSATHGLNNSITSHQCSILCRGRNSNTTMSGTHRRPCPEYQPKHDYSTTKRTSL